MLSCYLKKLTFLDIHRCDRKLHVSRANPLHFTPKHGSWLNQAELFFGVLQRRFGARGSFTSGAEFDARLQRFLEDYNARYAHPYRWTYTGEPLVRDTPFSRTRRQQCHGRSYFSPRPKRFERLDLTVDKRLSLTWIYEMLY